MAEAKTIKLLLSNGSLSGLLIVELSKWEGILLASPRSSYQMLSVEKEANFWGVYLLVSDNQVYIGQANDLLRRINEHDKSKDWWEKVILLTTKDNSLNRSDIDFLENRLINIAKIVGTLEMNNIQIGNSTKVSRYRETELNDFLDGGLLLLELIGVKVFNSQTKDSKTVKTTPPLSNELITHNSFDKLKRTNENHYINKGIALRILDENYYTEYKNNNVSYARLQENSLTYWINPRTEYLKEKWFLVLNDQTTNELNVFEVPANTFSIDNYSLKNKLFTRSDKPYYLDLNLTQSDYIDVKSKSSFLPYIKKVIKY